MNFGREDLWKNENAIKRQISLQTDVQVHIIMFCAIFQITWWTRNFWSVSWKNIAKKILIESLFACTISILNSFNFFGCTDNHYLYEGWYQGVRDFTELH